MRTIRIIIILALVLSCTAFAQNIDKAPKSYAPVKSSFSLFNPQRFHMTQSYSLMFSSSNSGRHSLGMYLNSIEYQVSDPLKIRLDLAYVHQPGALFNNSHGALSGGRLLPAISIDYRPLKNLYLRFDYSQVPSLYRGLNRNDNYWDHQNKE